MGRAIITNGVKIPYWTTLLIESPFKTVNIKIVQEPIVMLKLVQLRRMRVKSGKLIFYTVQFDATIV